MGGWKHPVAHDEDGHIIWGGDGYGHGIGFGVFGEPQVRTRGLWQVELTGTRQCSECVVHSINTEQSMPSWREPSHHVDGSAIRHENSIGASVLEPHPFGARNTSTRSTLDGDGLATGKRQQVFAVDDHGRRRSFQLHRKINRVGGIKHGPLGDTNREGNGRYSEKNDGNDEAHSFPFPHE